MLRTSLAHNRARETYARTAFNGFLIGNLGSLLRKQRGATARPVNAKYNPGEIAAAILAGFLGVVSCLVALSSVADHREEKTPPPVHAPTLHQPPQPIGEVVTV